MKKFPVILSIILALCLVAGTIVFADRCGRASTQIDYLTADYIDRAAQIETLTAADATQDVEDLSDITEGNYASTKRLTKQLKEHDFKSYSVSATSDGWL